ncbi:class I SAM-dependent methyltransferase [Nocardia sp. NPDC058519]|uniref:class I SAM-dependent methyltransferase n=1 Tax=Nocardia sp. NPDC058519 TaxID=3346535 RepID=UPI00365716C0
MSTEYDTTPTADPGIDAREAHWDRRADGFDTDFTHAPVREQVLDQISRQLPTGPCTALDAGTGSGRTMARLIQGLHPESDIVGCDLSPAMLHQARIHAPHKARGSLSFVYADLCALPFDDGGFDLVVSTFTLHHVPPTQQLAVLRELRRVLGEDGMLILADQIQPDPPLSVAAMRAAVAETFYPHLPHAEAVGLLSTYGEWPLTVGELTDLLEVAGFGCEVTDIHRIVALATATPGRPSPEE